MRNFAQKKKKTSGSNLWKLEHANTLSTGDFNQ